MDYIQYFDAFVGNPVDNQVSVKYDIAVYAAFGCKVAAFGMISIFIAKPFNEL